MATVARSFVRRFDGLRFMWSLLIAAAIVLGAVLSAPGWVFSPYGADVDGVPSVATVVK